MKKYIMSSEELKTWYIWRREQIKKLRVPKKRKPHLWSNRALRNRRKIAKYGIYKLGKRLPGSFESNSR